MDGLQAHERTHRGLARSFQLPRPFTSLTVAGNLRVPLVYTVNARPGAQLSPAEIDARCAELLQLVGLGDKAAQLSARPHPGRDAQARAGPRDGRRAEAADRRRSPWPGCRRPRSTDIVALLIRLNKRGITIILIEHIMRAVMSFSQRLVVLVSGKKIADGAPDVVIRDPEVERAYLGQ